MISEQEKKELDELARNFPTWQSHLRNFREKHHELSPQETIKKAGFTFRMKKGKIITNYVRKIM